MRRLQASSILLRNPGQAETMLVYRAGRIVYLDGVATQVAVKPYTMVGNVQPLGGKDLMLVPEAQRTKDNISVFTEQNEQTPTLNDRIFYKGQYYQVQNVSNWGSYSQLRAMLEDVGPQASR